MPSRFENTQRGERACRVSSEIRARAYFAVLLSLVNGDHTQSIGGWVCTSFSIFSNERFPLKICSTQG